MNMGLGLRGILLALGGAVVLAGCAPGEDSSAGSGLGGADSDVDGGHGSGGEADTRYTMALDMAEIMLLVLEPAADSLWDAAGWILDQDTGYEELYPTTDEGWQQMLGAAAVVAETGNLLALPERLRDNDAWLIYSQGLSQAGLQAMAAAAAQDEQAFFQAGAQLYSVCTACHQAYSPEVSNRFVAAD